MAYHPLQELLISSASYPAVTAPTVNCPFEPNSWTIVNLGTLATERVDVSFDGVNTHGCVIPGTPMAGLTFRTRYPKIWLKRNVAGADVTIKIMVGTEEVG